LPFLSSLALALGDSEEQSCPWEEHLPAKCPSVGTPELFALRSSEARYYT